MASDEYDIVFVLGRHHDDITVKALIRYFDPKTATAKFTLSTGDDRILEVNELIRLANQSSRNIIRLQLDPSAGVKNLILTINETTYIYQDDERPLDLDNLELNNNPQTNASSLVGQKIMMIRCKPELPADIDIS